MDYSEDEALFITQSSMNNDISAEIEEQRFRTPITASGCEKFDKSWVSDASHRKWARVLKVFEEWKKQRNEAVLKQDYSGEPVVEEDIDEMSDELLALIALKMLFRINKLMTIILLNTINCADHTISLRDSIYVHCLKVN
ncbi:unnamed protein product [Porites evermanni]|uniref:Uncharacterized protein n=1 Tax=Porites evermanni TaxID=104178 RepID=A0ABN8QXX6_9CNID|nr:unnamed protein product [Porites evermanni]